MTQTNYWETTGATKTFTHPLALDWLADLDRSARVLDYGCGYGRLMEELADQGFTDVAGVDTSSALIERGRSAHPALRFEVLSSPPSVAASDGSFDLALLFAVLTCVPDEETQAAIVAELRRLLAPGGLLYVSDLLIADDNASAPPYAEHARATGDPYGVFITGDGAKVRHHCREYLHELFSSFDVVAERELDVATMNGNVASGIQLLLRPKAAR